MEPAPSLATGWYEIHELGVCTKNAIQHEKDY